MTFTSPLRPELNSRQRWVCQKETRTHVVQTFLTTRTFLPSCRCVRYAAMPSLSLYSLSRTLWRAGVREMYVCILLSRIRARAFIDSGDPSSLGLGAVETRPNHVPMPIPISTPAVPPAMNCAFISVFSYILKIAKAIGVGGDVAWCGLCCWCEGVVSEVLIASRGCARGSGVRDSVR